MKFKILEAPAAETAALPPPTETSRPKFRMVQPPPQQEEGEGGTQRSNVAGKRDLGGETNWPVKDLNPYNPYVEGASWGAQGEIRSAIASPVESLINTFTGEGPTSVSENFQQNLARDERDKALYEEDNPTFSQVAQLAGGLKSGAKVGLKYIQGAKSGTGLAARSAVVGGGIGAVEGGMSTDGSLGDRAEGAAVGGAVGAVASSVLPPIFATSRALVRSLTNPIRSLANKESFAAQKVAEAAERDGMTPDRIAARLANAQRSKPEASVADVGGENMQKLLKVATNVPSQNRNSLVQGLERRQRGQLPRLQDDIGGALGDPKTYLGTVERAVDTRRNNAAPLFRQAYQTPTPYTFTLERVLQRPIAKQLVQAAKTAAQNRGEQFRGILIQQAPNGQVSARRVIDTPGLHRVLIEVNDQLRAIRNKEPTSLTNVTLRDLKIFKDHLTAAIQNAPLKDAIRQYAGDSALVNALDEGFEDGLKMAPEEIAKMLQAMTPSEAQMWRLGFSRAIADKIRDGGRTGVNRADVLLSPKYIQRLEAAIPDRRSRQELLKALDIEMKMARTRNTVKGGSPTHGLFAESAEAGTDPQAVQSALQAGAQVARGDWIGAFISQIGRAKSVAQGIRPEVADEIIRLMASRNPQDMARAKVLIDKAARSLEGAKGRRTLYDALRAASAGIAGGKVGEMAGENAGGSAASGKMQDRVGDMPPGAGTAPAAPAAAQALSPEILEQARAAIAKGADPAKVRQRLIDNGFDASGL